MTGPFQELAVALEAANLDEVQQKRNEFLRKFHITLENLLQKVWNDTLVTFKARVWVNLKINDCMRK